MNAKLELGLFGGDFQNDGSTTLTKSPRTATWKLNQRLSHSFWVDDAIRYGLQVPREKGIKDYAWIVEASSIRRDIKEFCITHNEAIVNRYDRVFTHDVEIQEAINSISITYDRCVIVPSHGALITDTGLHDKSKLISMVSSNKNYCPGHAYRLNWVEKLKDKVDLYGKGFNTIPTKEPALVPYMFSVVIENESYDCYWSEKILDAFVTGTVPIYHGAPSISKWFNPAGIIFLEDDFDPEKLSENDYYSRLPAIRDNFNRAIQIYTAEDFIVERFLDNEEGYEESIS